MSRAVVERPAPATSSKVNSLRLKITASQAAWLLVGLFLLANVPAFLRMGLDADATFWDLCARNILRGGTHYRDAAENNLPGMLWLHLAIRAVLGWCSEALRCVDVFVVTTIVVLLLKYVPAPPGPAFGCDTASQPHWARSLARPLTALALLACYFTTSEWCHCQRDVWMLLPALVALGLREQQLQRIQSETGHLVSILGGGLLEGLVWASAFWIKPHVGIPAFCAWLTGAILTLRSRSGSLRCLLVDLAGLIVGGLSAGAAGTAWIVWTGASPAFREIMFGWNPQYSAFDVMLGAPKSQILAAVIHRVPWILVNVVAVPLAVSQWFGVYRSRDRSRGSAGLLPSFYLGCVFQSFFLQHPYDYVFVPATLLGLVVVAASLEGLPRIVTQAALASCLSLVFIWHFPQLLTHRIALWTTCLGRPGNPVLRDELTLYGAVSWEDLDRVAQFLKQQDLQDGELTCYSMRTIALYEMLGLVPSTRYYYVENCLVILGPPEREQIKADLARSRQRYIVHDLKRLQLSDDEIRALSDGRPLPIPQFDRPPIPWSQSIVFRAGRYIVLAVPAQDMPRWLESSFGL